MAVSGQRLIPAPHGQLEALYRPASNQAERVAVILHPHPQYGGTMHNKVVFHAAHALDQVGFATLRFNFRGVGLSTGSFDDGRGEVDDARAALDYLLNDQPSASEVLLVGFSFGAAIGLRFGCADPRVHRLIAIATPARYFDLDFLVGCAKPKLFVHGTRDDVAPLGALEELLHRQPKNTDLQLARIEGADHFFEYTLDELEREITRFVAR